MAEAKSMDLIKASCEVSWCRILHSFIHEDVAHSICLRRCSSLLLFLLFFCHQELRVIVAGNEERYARDWYSRHRTEPVAGSGTPGTKLSLFIII